MSYAGTSLSYWYYVSHLKTQTYYSRDSFNSYKLRGNNGVSGSHEAFPTTSKFTLCWVLMYVHSISYSTVPYVIGHGFHSHRRRRVIRYYFGSGKLCVIGSPDLDGGSLVPVPVIFLSRSKSCASFSFCQMLNYTNCDVAPTLSWRKGKVWLRDKYIDSWSSAAHVVS